MHRDGALGLALAEPTVEVAPGGRAAIRAEVTNGGPDAVRARVRVSGRASSWVGGPDGDVVHVPAGGAETVTLAVRPPRSHADGELVPFVVHVDGAEGDHASASGLVVLVAQRGADVAVTPRSVTTRRTADYEVELRGVGEAGVVALRAAPDGSRLRLWLHAPTVAVPAEGTASVRLTVQATRPALLAPVRHDVAVAWELLGDGEGRGTARAVLHQRPVLPLPVTLLVLAAVFLATVVGARVLLGRDPLPFAVPGVPAASSGPADPTPVTTPYVQLDAVPQGADPEASRALADELADDLGAAGVPGVRVVDNADLPGGVAVDAPFWVLVVDGFDDLGEATAFCREHESSSRSRCLPVG